MKIAILSAEYPPIWGGVGVYVYNLSNVLKILGHDVHIVTRRKRGERVEAKKNNDNIYVHTVPWLYVPLLHSLSFGKNAVLELEKIGNEFDIVHVQCPTISISRRYMDRIRLPLVSTMHGTWKGEQDALRNESIGHLRKGDFDIYIASPFLKKYEKAMLIESKAVIAVSAYCAEELLSYKIPQDMLKSKLKVIPNGVDTESFKPMGESVKQALRERYRLDKDDLIILTVGRLVARKGFKDLLWAFKVVSQRIKNANLILVGSGPLEATLKRLVVKFKISDKVIIAKGLAIKELKMHYAGADLFVLPSYYEGQGIVFLEAMASGIPIVSTNISAIPETVRHGENGLLVKPGNTTELADAIIQLLEDEELRIRMGKTGREIAVREYEWSIIGRKIEKVYERVSR